MWGTIQKPQTSTIRYWAGSLREKAGLQGEQLEHSETQKGMIDRMAMPRPMMGCVGMTTDCMRMVFGGVLEPWNQ